MMQVSKTVTICYRAIRNRGKYFKKQGESKMEKVEVSTVEREDLSKKKNNATQIFGSDHESQRKKLTTYKKAGTQPFLMNVSLDM